MAALPVPDEKLKALVDLWEKLHRNTSHLAATLKLPRTTVAHRLDNARRRGLVGTPPKPRIRVKAGSAPVAPTPEPDAVDERRGLDERTVLRQRIAALERRIIAEEAWRQRFTSLHGTADEPVDWLPTPAVGRQNSMIPVLFTSDFQCGEVIRPEEIDGINAYNQEIFIDRYQRMIEKTVDLARNCTGATDFPYAIYLRGGDAISGEIHEELAQTNDLSSVPALRLLQQQEREGIRKLRSEFGRVRVISIGGNHGRTTAKPHAKGYTERSYETLLSWWLADTFEGDPNVTFYTPKSGEALFEVAGWNWLMAHGDRMGSKGGKGFIGPSATIARGHAKLYQNWAATGRRLDLILTGHLHTSVKLERGYANGCFPPGQPVMLSDGTEKPIETIVVGDNVVTKDGENRVEAVMPQSFNGHLMGLRMGAKNQEILCTPNHEIFAVKASSMGVASTPASWIRGAYCPDPKWIPAEYISAGDYIMAAWPTSTESLSWLDADLAWLLGMYLAEGSLNSRRKDVFGQLVFTHHINEVDIANRVEAILRKTFPGKHLNHVARPNKSIREIVVSSGAICDWFYALCGKGSLTKRICGGLMKAPPHLQKQIMLGWMLGDGHIRPVSYRGGRQVSASTVSRCLVMQMRAIALRNGLTPFINALHPGEGGRRKNTAYTLGFSGKQACALSEELGKPQKLPDRDNTYGVRWVDGKAFYRVSDVWREAYSGPVYDLQVATDRSYSVNGFVVHNSVAGYSEFARDIQALPDTAKQWLLFAHEKHMVSHAFELVLSERPQRMPAFRNVGHE